MVPERSSLNWETVGTIPIGRRISVSDTSYFYDEPVLVSVPTGEYRLMIRPGKSDGDKYISALRVARGSDVSRGSRLGDVIVDFGQVGVCDRDAVERAFDVLGDAGMPAYYQQLQTTDLIRIVTLPDNVNMFAVRSGFGDGLYPVYMLGSSAQMPAGIEIDFEHAIRRG
jgi:hypothetical protein